MPLDGAYVYRDWVVKAMNSDLSYDKFVKMQLAGDLMSKKPTRTNSKPPPSSGRPLDLGSGRARARPRRRTQ